MAHGVVRTDKLWGTDVRSGLASFVYMGSGTTPADIDNGNVVKITELQDGEREVYVAVTPAANTELKDILLVADPEVMYEESKRNLDEFYSKAGEIVRGYYLHTNDIFSVTKDALDGAANPKKGDIVELKAGTKLNVVTSASASATKVGKIIDVNVVGMYTYYAIQVD